MKKTFIAMGVLSAVLASSFVFADDMNNTTTTTPGATGTMDPSGQVSNNPQSATMSPNAPSTNTMMPNDTTAPSAGNTSTNTGTTNQNQTTGSY